MGTNDPPGDASSPPVTHAGAVAVRNGHEYLLVRSTGRDVEWVLPKGHIEHGETSEEAALRELREEAGVIGRIVRPLMTQSLPNGPVVDFFLVDVQGEVAREEQREMRWCALDDAMQLATFEETREILRRAKEMPWK